MAARRPAAERHVDDVAVERAVHVISNAITVAVLIDDPLRFVSPSL